MNVSQGLPELYFFPDLTGRHLCVSTALHVSISQALLQLFTSEHFHCEHFHCEGHSSHLPQSCEFLENKHNTPENYFEDAWMWLIVMCFSELSLTVLLINSGTFGLACTPPGLLLETDSVTC